MKPLLLRLQSLAGEQASGVKALTMPAFVVLMLSMMVLPLPPLALDLLFTLNIAMALMVMMVSSQMIKPLDFAALPTVLLLSLIHI